MTTEDDAFSRRALRAQQLIDAIKAGDGFIARNLETGEVEISPPRVTPETKAAAGEAGLN